MLNEEKLRIALDSLTESVDDLISKEFENQPLRGVTATKLRIGLAKHFERYKQAERIIFNILKKETKQDISSSPEQITYRDPRAARLYKYFYDIRSVFNSLAKFLNVSYLHEELTKQDVKEIINSIGVMVNTYEAIDAALIEYIHSPDNHLIKQPKVAREMTNLFKLLKTELYKLVPKLRNDPKFTTQDPETPREPIDPDYYEHEYATEWPKISRPGSIRKKEKLERNPFVRAARAYNPPPEKFLRM